MDRRPWTERQRARSSRPQRARGGYTGGSVYPLRNPYFSPGSFGIPGTHGVFSLQGNGLQSLTSGMGGPGDRSTEAFFQPTWVTSRYELEVFGNQSWAAGKLIGTPVDDCLVRWRSFRDNGEDQAYTTAKEAFMDAEENWNLRQVLGRAMKAGRQFGTSITLMRVNDVMDWSMPLIPQMIRPGDLVGFSTYDCWSVRVAERDAELNSLTYGQPLVYEIFPDTSRNFFVHASRVLRFDGIAPQTVGGWDAYTQDWGVSVLVPVAQHILQHAMICSAMAHLSQEASMMLVRMGGFRDFAGGEEDAVEEPGDDPNIVARAISAMKSNWRMAVVDADDAVERINYNFAGLDKIHDKLVEDIAAAGDIPLTRFLGQSPGGLDSSGDSDAKNYALLIAGMQARMLTAPTKQADVVIARDAGLDDPPAFDWQPLVDLTDQEQAEILKTTSEAATGMVGSFIATEGDAQRLVSERTGFRFREGVPEPPEPDLGIEEE